MLDEVAVRDEFLSPQQVNALLDCVRRRRDRGDFYAARIGGGAHLQQRDEIRGDSTCWLAEPLFAAEQRLLGALEGLRLELNRQSFLGLFDLELHYAWYPPGAAYARHVDQLRGNDLRRVSWVVYLNNDWQPQFGGQLRLFEPGGAYRDIAPVAGRLVFFSSSGREHEVLPTTQARLSVSGWFKRRA